ncbi:hypothetical protein [Sinomonas humi]|uniref:DUF3188 domain-containing protein n=1 Tax=Sinomonas humi TaxID=1338436 RepID=A0A0B2AJ41_9MICC|nr:hypothetical protein [Sinomonas humi]KHL01797.1 hypothetical protein LK10_14530 [Sinomonas humi]
MNDFWETAPPLYRKVVLSGMAFLGVGIICNIVANLANVVWLLFVSLAIIAVGIVAHLFGIGIRAREMRRRLRG